MAVKQRMYPEQEHLPGLMMHLHHVRFLYNLGLEQRSMWTRAKHQRGPLSAPRISYLTQAKELAQLRKELDWLRAGSSSVQQAALRDLDRAFANFFTGHGRHPRFRSRDDRSGSFYLRDLSLVRLNRKWGTVMVPKVGPVRFKISRPWAEILAATSARVTLRNGRWQVAFTTPPPPKITAGTGAMVGIDRGVANTIATSDGQLHHIPGLTPGEQRRFLALEQKLARQTRAAKKTKRRLVECRNRNKTLDQLARLRARLDDRRTDWVEQTTTHLARSSDGTVIERLQVPNMVKATKPKPDPDTPGVFLSNRARAKAALNRLILGSRWGQFATRLTHKSVVVTVPAAYSSQECRTCHHIAPENRESQAVFTCVNCGHSGHADTNAAQVILGRGEDRLLQLLADQPGDTGGSPAPSTPTPMRSRRNQTQGQPRAA